MVGLARQLRKSDDALDGYAAAAACERGDFMEYAGLRRSLGDLEAHRAKARRYDRRREAEESVESLRPGDVIDVPAGKYSGIALVIDPGVRSDREGPRPYVLTIDRHARRLSMVDFPTPVSSLSRLKVPELQRADPQARRDLASTLRQRTQDLPPRRRRARPPTATRGATGRSSSCAGGSARTPVTAVPTARTTPGGPSAGRSCTATPRRCDAGSSSARTRSRAASTGSARCSPSSTT